jgi:hypothetical protein
MKHRSLALAIAALAIAPLATPASAFFDRDRGCATPNAVECYKAVQTPDLYTVRHKQVMVKPGWWETRTIPAVYGNRQKQVMVTPGQTVWHTTPAQWGSVQEQRVVQPGYQAWVRSGANQRRDFLGDIFGRGRDGDGCGCAQQTTCETVCKVAVPPQVETVERKVMVAPEKRVAQHVPATYQWVNEPYLIRPAKTERMFHPPVYETVAERVLVQRGTTTYQPVSAPAMPCASPCAPAMAPAPCASPCGAMPGYQPVAMPMQAAPAENYNSDDDAPEPIEGKRHKSMK